MNNSVDQQTALFASAFVYSEIRNVPRSAWLGHGPFALWLVETMRPKTIVELGSHRGFSFFTFCQAMKDLGLPGVVHAVDTWKGDQHAGFYEEDIYGEVVETVSKQFNKIGRLHRMTFDQAVSSFDDLAVDILHIDGLHTYEAVRHDYETWRHKVRAGGVILFHDIAQRRDDFGVWRLWGELSRTSDSFEFFHSHGLGVLGIGKDFPRGLSKLFSMDTSSDSAERVRQQFARLGDKYELLQAKQNIAHLQNTKSWQLTELMRRSEKSARGFLYRARTNWSLGKLSGREMLALRKIMSRIRRYWRIIMPLRRAETVIRAGLARLRRGKLPAQIANPLEIIFRRLFSTQVWQPPKDIEDQLQRYVSRPKCRRRAIVYTAIIGGYDRLMIPEIIDPEVDYVCFSDRPINGYGVWQIRPVPFHSCDRTLTARFVKTHPFLLLDEADHYAWIDGNIRIIGDVKAYLDEAGPSMGFLDHPLRRSIQEEAQACIDCGKDIAQDIRKQTKHYREEGVINTLPLFETNFFVARNSDALRPFFNQWWNEIELHTRRDQLSVGYALNKTDTPFRYLLPKGLCTRNHPDFQFVRHTALRGSTEAEVLSGIGRDSDPWAFSCSRPSRTGNISVDVIICVHNALEHVRPCLDSVMNANDSPNRLIIVNDASDKATTTYLRRMSGVYSDRIELVENDSNIGYTKSANIGLSTSNADFRVLLNSDTIVASGWLEKLTAAAFADKAIGIVGPMSNAASYQSLPSIHRSVDQTAINALPKGVTPADLDRACARWSAGYDLAIVPLVHGFCIGIKSTVISRIGLFDEINFERFYGEENDYCLRARAAGFLLAVSTNTFVYHAKSKSISEESRLIWMEKAGTRLREIHGIDTVIDACRQMEENPALKLMRRKATEGWANLGVSS